MIQRTLRVHTILARNIKPQYFIAKLNARKIAFYRKVKKVVYVQNNLVLRFVLCHVQN